MAISATTFISVSAGLPSCSARLVISSSVKTRLASVGSLIGVIDWIHLKREIESRARGGAHPEKQKMWDEDARFKTEATNYLNLGETP